MTRIAIKSQILRWAIDRAELNFTDLERKFPKLNLWLDGTGQPTLKQAEGFARATLIPFGYLFLEEPPEEVLSIPYFRTLGQETRRPFSINLFDTLNYMQQRRDWMREFVLEQGQPALPFVGSANVQSSPLEIAQEMRSALGFSENWASGFTTWTDALRALQAAIDSLGVLVVVNGVVGHNTHRVLDPLDFRGFVLVDDYAPLIFVNGSDSKAAQMFTLAHEFAHIYFGSSAAFDLRNLEPSDNAIEKLCDKVAAEFLVNEGLLRNFWPTARDSEDPFQKVARYFKVSELVVARRLLDLGLITRNGFLEFYEAYVKHDRQESKGASGGDFYATENLRIGKRFAAAVMQSTQEGKLLYRDAFRLTDLYGKTFESYMTRQGFGT